MFNTLKNAVDLEIFVVNIFSWFVRTTKIKKHEIYFTMIDHVNEK